MTEIKLDLVGRINIIAVLDSATAGSGGRYRLRQIDELFNIVDFSPEEKEHIIYTQLADGKMNWRLDQPELGNTSFGEKRIQLEESQAKLLLGELRRHLPNMTRRDRKWLDPLMDSLELEDSKSK